MLINTVKIHRLGPFHDPLVLELDPRVTIVTGANDVGKSSLLRAIALALSDVPMPDEFANHDHVQDALPAPAKDASIQTEALLTLHEPSDLLSSNGEAFTKGDRAEYQRSPAREVAGTVHRVHYQNRKPSVNSRIKLPAVVQPGKGENFLVGSEINLEKPNDLERRLLDVAFRAPFDFAKFREMMPHRWSVAVGLAEHELNRLLERVLPRPGSIRFKLREDFAGKRERLGVLLLDGHQAVTPFGDRGSGVRRMITLLAELVTAHRGAHHKVILLDEPENSLHADAQHLLREFLYELTADGRTQVVYATHSPAMVNPMRGRQIRVLERAQTKENLPTSRLVPRGEEANFHAVRTSLGVSAADSLLYAPVVVITEGSTEVRCIPEVIEKVKPIGVFKDLSPSKLLGLSIFLDGGGGFARVPLQAGEGARSAGRGGCRRRQAAAARAAEAMGKASRRGVRVSSRRERVRGDRACREIFCSAG